MLDAFQDAWASCGEVWAIIGYSSPCFVSWLKESSNRFVDVKSRFISLFPMEMDGHDERDKEQGR